MRRELHEEQNLNFTRLGDLRKELAKAKEDLEQERNETAHAVERWNYWETESQEQSETIDTLRDHTDCTWEGHYYQKCHENMSLKQQITEAEETNKNLEAELLSKAKVEEDLSEKVKELEKKVNESASKKLGDENISLKEQIAKKEAEVKRLQSESLSKTAEVATVKKEMETATQAEVSKTKSMLGELNQVNLTKTREIEHLTNQIDQKQKDFDIHVQQLLKRETQQLIKQKEVEDAHQKRENQLKLDVAKKTAEVEELEKKIE